MIFSFSFSSPKNLSEFSRSELLWTISLSNGTKGTHGKLIIVYYKLFRLLCQAGNNVFCVFSSYFHKSVIIFHYKKIKREGCGVFGLKSLSNAKKSAKIKG
jgi:hypothetical protein